MNHWDRNWYTDHEMPAWQLALGVAAVLSVVALGMWLAG